MCTATEHNHERKLDPAEDGGVLEALAALSDEELEAKAAEIMMDRAMRENPLLGQLNDMFSQWEAMMESYRQEELEEQPDQDGDRL